MTQAGVGTNRYSYSFNDPVNLSDPGGNSWLSDAWNDFKSAVADAGSLFSDMFSGDPARTSSALTFSHFANTSGVDYGYSEFRQAALPLLQGTSSVSASGSDVGRNPTLNFMTGTGAVAGAGGSIVAPFPGAVRPGANLGRRVDDLALLFVINAKLSAESLLAVIHGNSLESRRQTELYYLIDRAYGGIEKIGITSRLSSFGQQQRYTQSYLDSHNVDYVRQRVFGSRYAAAVAENIELVHFALDNKRLPTLNWNFR